VQEKARKDYIGTLGAEQFRSNLVVNLRSAQETWFGAATSPGLDHARASRSKPWSRRGRRGLPGPV